MLFSNQKKHSLKIPTTASSEDGSATSPRTIQFLVDYLCESVMKDSRKELFVLDGTVYVLLSSAPFFRRFPTHSL
jgi:ubiquitin related modifier 1